MLRKKGFAAFIVSFLLLTFVFAFPDTAFASDVVTIKTVPLYRCWNGYVHWYTTNEAERDGWLASGFSDEGITCYVSPVPLPYTVPLYKSMLYNDMYYTTNSAARDAVAGQYGFTYIGIEGYVIPGNDTSYGDVNINRWYRPEPNNSDGWEWLTGEAFSSSQRHHFYQVEPGTIPGYSYEGVAFRAWDSSELLQKIEVTAPNGGETFKAGDVVSIKWVSDVDGGEMNLYYGMDGPASTTLYKIEEELSNNGSFKWTVPNKSGSNAVIEARWFYYDNETNSWSYANDTSNSGFSITGGTIIPGLIIKPGIEPSVFKIFPSAPTSLTVNPHLLSRLDLFWKDNSNNETGFSIERRSKNGGYAQIATVGADVTKYSDTSAALDTTYYYRVKAIGNFDSGYSNEASATLNKSVLKPNIELLVNKLAPEAPSNLKTSSVSGDPKGVKLSWKANDSDIDGYIIERKSGAGDWEMTSTAGADKTTVNETDLKSNTIYSYRVKAYKLYMNSDPSNIIVFNTATAEKPVISSQTILDFFIGDDSFKINEATSILDVKPIIKDGRTLIPIRYVTEPLGAEIQWIDGEKKVIINQDSKVIELWIGTNNAKISGKNVPIDPDNTTVMPLIINGRTMMPLRFIAENLGCEVKWIPEYKQVKIIYPGNMLDPQPEPPKN